MNNLHAYILRGLPGSGKSTTAHSIASRYGHLPGPYCKDGVLYYQSTSEDIFSAVHSTDTFFMVDGEYKFDQRNLGQYHSRNFKNFKKSIDQEIPVIICDNTNTTRKEFVKYLEAARRKGYITSIVTMPHPSIEMCIERNTHDVPEEVIRKMIRRWEPYNGRKK